MLTEYDFFKDRLKLIYENSEVSDMSLGRLYSIMSYASEAYKEYMFASSNKQAQMEKEFYENNP